MGDDDDRHINLSGRWIGKDPEGIGTATLHHEGDRITGDGTGGSVHPTLTNKFELEGQGRRYVGKYTNVEGVATGRGRIEIDVIDAHTIDMAWNGDWSGGGSGGHTEGRTKMHRQ